MARLIDADALKTTVDLECLCLTQYYDEESYLAGVCDVLACVDGAPTIEAEPVKHGKWEITDAFPHIVYCGVCHKRYAQTSWQVWKDSSLPRNYCPNCGAKMGEVEK